VPFGYKTSHDAQGKATGLAPCPDQTRGTRPGPDRTVPGRHRRPGGLRAPLRTRDRHRRPARAPGTHDQGPARRPRRGAVGGRGR
jgi:hypothetical protein